MGRGSSQKVAILSRRQMEMVLTYMRLHEDVGTVVILERAESGLGPTVHARFYRSGTQSYHEIDITDVESW